jgi:hypothetical protein
MSQKEKKLSDNDRWAVKKLFHLEKNVSIHQEKM